MVTRRGLGRGLGRGYKNLIPRDKAVHSMSRRGIRQPQRIVDDSLLEKFIDSLRKQKNLKIKFETDGGLFSKGFKLILPNGDVLQAKASKSLFGDKEFELELVRKKQKGDKK